MTDYELTASDILALLRPYVEAREQRDAYAGQVERLASLIKGYLDAHTGEEMYDGEAGIIAKLQERHASPTYEPASMPPELIDRLHKAGALGVSPALLRALEGQEIADLVKPYARPGSVTRALTVVVARPLTREWTVVGARPPWV